MICMILPKLHTGSGSSRATQGSSERVASSITLRSRTVSSLSGSTGSERLAVERSGKDTAPAHARTRAASSESPGPVIRQARFEDFEPVAVSLAIGKPPLISALATQMEHRSAGDRGCGALRMTTLRRFTHLAATILSLTTLAGAAHAQCEPFGPVWATMTQEQGGDRPGCRGCHVGPAPVYVRWFGDTEEAVLNYFMAGGGMTLV